MDINEKFKEEMKKKKRVVVKVGSSTITHKNGTINLSRIDELAWELVNLRNNDIDVILVSSGAIACGSQRLNLKHRPSTTEEKQAAASVGQVILIQVYQRAFAEFGYHASQLLLTNTIEHDIEMRCHAKNTFAALKNLHAIPVVNENDTIATKEIEFGDNDNLSATIAKLVEADLLILLSDIKGLYTKDPNLDEKAEFIPYVEDISKVKHMGTDSQSNVGSGGMITKLYAADSATRAGIDVVLAEGSDTRAITKINRGELIGTWFKGVRDV